MPETRPRGGPARRFGSALAALTLAAGALFTPAVAQAATVAPTAPAAPAEVSASSDAECRPDGLYPTPGVDVPYCDVYDTDGREKLPNDLDRRVIGYFTSWRNGANGQPEYLADDIPWDRISHINYAFAHVGPDNRVSVGADTPDNPATGMTWEGLEPDPEFDYQGHFNLLNSFKKEHPGVKTLVAVGGWAETGGYFDADGERVASGGFYSMTTTPTGVNHEGIETFADSAVEFVREYGFDGLDIDYEYATSNNGAGSPDDFWISDARRGLLWEGYEELMRVLREKLDEASAQDGTYYQLTAAVPASGWLLRGQEVHQVVQYLDFVNMMTYDLHGTWNHFVGHNGALYDSGLDPELSAVYGAYNGIGYLNADWAHHYFRGAMQAGRINLGVPFYTRGWTDVQGGTNGLWGTSALPDQTQCPPGTGVNTPCGNGAGGIDNLWHDSDPVTGGEIPAGANPIWHVLNLEDGVVGDYVDDYGVDGTLEGTYVRHWDDVTKNEWWWNAQTRTFLTGDAEQTIRTKADYVADTGLGGVMIWEMAGDYSYNTAAGQYEMGDTLITSLHETLSNAGPYGALKAETEAPAEVLDVDVDFGEFALGDNNYPINPKVTITNNSAAEIPGGSKITFDYGTSAPGNMGDQSGLGLTHLQIGHDRANNVGGLDGDFHRAQITVPGWQSIPAGGTFSFDLSWRLPIAQPSNWRIEVGGTEYAITYDHPRKGTVVEGPGGGDPGGGEPGDCTAPAWASGTVYNGGDVVSHNGSEWRAQWWTQGDEPGTTGEWGVWRLVGAC
ncbi:chitinase C-terminal domain-containing protein [Nocardiopsis changdeensis]|uniref:Chitinase C-terminal domain-containing protein n=1 Tax=Nocardiopsis changdeensis TaxID=2831969 RepID=A0ABX8BP00_9ACTN|nr:MULTISPECIES: glycosyl hydrolase family 18 protein [Nocardiopsis]QUX23814.1 chitinase C-terminal domain-containing protein [Nocardiopsis changdeensis]QYX39759.1 chitinase C-terminal domain-containing protein [Nocardiopsis sp. MT53]